MHTFSLLFTNRTDNTTLEKNRNEETNFKWKTCQLNSFESSPRDCIVIYQAEQMNISFSGNRAQWEGLWRSLKNECLCGVHASLLNSLLRANLRLFALQSIIFIKLLDRLHWRILRKQAMERSTDSKCSSSVLSACQALGLFSTNLSSVVQLVAPVRNLNHQVVWSSNRCCDAEHW